MELLIITIISVAVITGVMAVLSWINRERLAALERLDSLAREREEEIMPLSLHQPLRTRLADTFFPFLGRFVERLVPGNKRENYEQRLTSAGRPGGMAAETFIATKYLFILVALAIGFLSGSALTFIVAAIVGIMAPDMFLKNSEKRRKEKMIKSLPDVLDLISVSVEAGLSFDAALQKVVEKTSGPLTQEFEKTLQEINMGKPRREALRDMADRINVNDITIFLSAVIQADQLGVSISNVLSIQSKQVRENRRIRAEEAAQKAPIKILIPLVVFIFPTLLVVLLGPAVLQILDTF